LKKEEEGKKNETSKIFVVRVLFRRVVGCLFALFEREAILVALKSNEIQKTKKQPHTREETAFCTAAHVFILLFIFLSTCR